MLRTSLIVLALLFVVAPRPASAQVVPTPSAPAATSIIVIDQGGKLLPIEQFEAHVDAACPGEAGAPPPAYFRTRTRGPAIAIDLSEVPDPAPTGCGFGLTTVNARGAAALVIAGVTPEAIAAWTRRTGLMPTVMAVDAAPPSVATPVPLPVATPTPPPSTAANAAEAMHRFRLALGFGLPLALAVGLLVGSLVYRRAQRQSETLDDMTLADETSAAIEDADLDDRLAHGHRGMLAEHSERVATDAPPIDEPVEDADGDPSDDRA